MTQRHESDTGPDLARWRGALMLVLPKSHPIHDPTRAFTEAELELFEQQAAARHGWNR